MSACVRLWNLLKFVVVVTLNLVCAARLFSCAMRVSAPVELPFHTKLPLCVAPAPEPFDPLHRFLLLLSFPLQFAVMCECVCVCVCLDSVSVVLC